MTGFYADLVDRLDLQQVVWDTAITALIQSWLLARHPEHPDADVPRLVVLIREGVGARPLSEPLIPHFEGAYQMALTALDEGNSDGQ